MMINQELLKYVKYAVYLWLTIIFPSSVAIWGVYHRRQKAAPFPKINNPILELEEHIV